MSVNGMNPIELKREFGKDICFYGGMDLQKTFISGTTEDVENELKSLIETLGRAGGLRR
jgi:uroporphyrinogen decarboxylase